MASTPEGKVKTAVKKYLTSIDAWYCMPATGGFGQSGVPDFLVCWKGLFYGIETKAPGGRPTPYQVHQLRAIRLTGGYEAIIVDKNDLTEFLTRLMVITKLTQ